MTTAEVAARLGRSVATVNRWATTGKLAPAYELPGANGARLYEPAAVEQIETQLAGER